MSESTLESHWREDGILVYRAKDTSPATVEQWQQESLALLDKIDKYSKCLYDLRELSTLSIMALRTDIRLKAHPNARFCLRRSFTRNTRTASLVQTVLSIQPGGNFQIMMTEEAAIDWLNNKVSPAMSFYPRD